MKSKVVFYLLLFILFIPASIYAGKIPPNSMAIGDTFFSSDNPKIQYIGRIDWKDSKAPRFSNPGVYITICFKGTYCDIDMEDETNLNYIAIVIDNQSPIRILVEKGRNSYRVAENLTDSLHNLLICKETEASVGALTFYGLKCLALEMVKNIPVRKIECYGNSITCGAKMLLGTPCDLTNNNSNWNAANSAYLSYGAKTARNLNAQWQITAYSGIGLIHSCCNLNFTLPHIFDRLYLNDPLSPPWNFQKYVPDVVTICLGQNDGTYKVSTNNFKMAYIEFIKAIRKKYPNTTIFCLTSPMADSSGSSTCLYHVMKTVLYEIVDTFNNSGDFKVYWVALPHDQNKGCPGQDHPGEKDHEQSAAALSSAIKQIMNW